MKDITFVFSVVLMLVLGIDSLDQAIEKLSLSAATQAGHQLPGFYSSHQAALASASEDDRPIVLVFGRSGDLATEDFKNQVLRSSNVQSVKEHFIWAFIDIEQSVHQETAKRFHIKSTPSVCVVDRTGRELTRLSGSTPAHALIGRLAVCLRHKKA